MRTTTQRLAVWSIVIVLILLVPFVAQQFTDEVAWSLADFGSAGAALFGACLAYELIAQRSRRTVYRFAFGIGLLGALLLFWVNGAVGIIGSENNPANLLYGAVFVVGLLGALISRFQARGMAWTLATATATQLAVPLFALFVWPSQTSWGAAGVAGVFALNAIFAALFLASALLFWRAARSAQPSGATIGA